MQIGNYNCHSVDMGSFLLDGGAMFGVVPKALWAKKISPDKNNRIPMKSRTLLIKGEDRNILVDTGCGNKLPEKLKSIYGIKNIQPDVNKQLEVFGLKKDEITDVILTHLHFDHAGGATEDQKGDIVPTFKNATYHVHKDQWETALSPSERDKASYFPENYLPLKEAGLLNILETGEQPIDDIEFIVSDGHTKGQLLPILKSSSTPLFYCGDLIPTSAHIPVAWHMGYDNYPLTIIKEKSVVLERAYQEKWKLFFEHDPIVTACTLKKNNKGIVLDEILTF